MDGKTQPRRSQSGISFLARVLSIAVVCLIPLLLANSQARAEGPVIVGPQIDIYVGAGPQEMRPAFPHSFVAFDAINNRFLVVWDDDRIYGDWNIYGQMVNADGTLYGNPVAISMAAGSNQYTPMPVFDPINERFLVIWNDTRGGIWGQFVTNNGSLWGDNFDIFGGWTGLGFIVFDATSNRFLVLWTNGPGTPHNLVGRFVNPDGTLQPPFQITNYTDGDGAWYGAAAFDSNNARFLIANSGPDGHIYGRLLKVDGTPYSEEFSISTTIYSGGNALESVTFDPFASRFLVTWGALNTVKGRVMNADGTPHGDEFTIADYFSGSSSTVFDSTSHKFLVVGFGEWPVFGQFLNPDGTFHGSRFPILATGYISPISSYAAFGSGATGSLVVWSDQPYPETGYDIFGKLVRLTGICVVTNTNDGGPGSLRQCLLDAQSGDSITFDPAVFPPGSPATIALTGVLPEITQGNLTIDGTGAGVILNGSAVGVGNGFTIRSNGNTIRELQIMSFPGDGINISQGASDNLIANNVISGNTDPVYAAGVRIDGAGTSNNTVIGNYIGTDASGTAALGNGGPDGGAGVSILNGASQNTIGGDTPTERNLISGNNGVGVQILFDASSNTVSGNYIGTDVSGANALPNTDFGVQVGEGSSNNLIGGINASPGGACSGQCNLISGNNDNGVTLENNGTANNVVSGNYIGTDANGTAAIPNGSDGVDIFDQASHNTIGGATPGERNLISGNSRSGVSIYGAGTVNNTVSGNYIGTDVSGTKVIANSNPGVHIHDGAQYNLIGGTNANPGGACTGQCNLISGNGFFGIRIGYPGPNTISGNYIGTDVSGTGNLGNELNGIHIADSNGNVIGGAAPGAGNLIAFSGSHGVLILPGTSNAILSNSMFANGGLGIDLDGGGVTPNDPGDGDTGSNNLQNFPVLTSAETNNGSTLIQVAFESTPNTTFTFEFFANTACDPSSYGEGADFLISATQATDASGQASFAVSAPAPVPDGQFITATATDPNGNTSEFSQCVAVQALDGVVGPSGGSVVDTAGSGAALSVGPGVLPAETNIFIQVIPDPGVSPPPGFIGPATGFVNMTMEPNPSPLPAPGATLTLPLLVPLPPGTLLELFRYDPATNALIDANIAGTVDPGGATATFSGVTEFSIFVGVQSAPAILDDFNRKNGILGAKWDGAILPLNYLIVNKAVSVLAGGPIYWKPDTFGPDQEAQVTLTRLDNDGQHSVLLKVQTYRGQPIWTKGVIAIFYNTQAKDKVGIQTYVPGKGWKTILSVPMTLRNGDVLGGRALTNGDIHVLVNGVLIGSAHTEFFAGKGGSIGVWFLRSTRARFDDFGGKNLPQ